MNQLAQKYRQQVAGIEMAVRPIVDLTGLDGQENRNVGASRDGFLFPAPIMAVELGLKFKKFPAVDTKRLFQPESHSG